MRGLVMAVAAALAFSACGGSMNGTIAGTSLAVADSIFFVAKDSAGKTQGLYVIMADKPNLCTTLKANRQPKSATSLVMSMMRVANLEILAPDVGDYTVTDTFSANGNFASAGFSKTDANCTDVLASNATGGRSGTVKITSLSAQANGVAAGTYDITFGSQADKVTGNFNATYCEATSVGNNPNCE